MIGERYTVPASGLAKGIVTPLTYGDALALAERNADGWLPAVTLSQLAHVLMAVDTAARKQAQEPLLVALKAAREGIRCYSHKAVNGVVAADAPQPGCDCWGCDTARTSDSAIALAEGR